MKFASNRIAMFVAAATLSLSGAAQAGALDQLKAFASGTKAARGEFTQQQQGKTKSGKAAPVSSGSSAASSKKSLSTI